MSLMQHVVKTLITNPLLLYCHLLLHLHLELRDMYDHYALARRSVRSVDEAQNYHVLLQYQMRTASGVLTPLVGMCQCQGV